MRSIVDTDRVLTSKRADEEQTLVRASAGGPSQAGRAIEATPTSIQKAYLSRTYGVHSLLVGLL
jgi:hypothetical protein